MVPAKKDMIQNIIQCQCCVKGHVLVYVLPKSGARGTSMNVSPSQTGIANTRDGVRYTGPRGKMGL